MIDIGGTALIRAAAKNHAGVTVIVDPADYGRVVAELEAHGGDTTAALRRSLAAKAFARIAAYDGAIARWFASREGELLPERLILGATRRQTMRYGENPHQRAAFYVTDQGRPERRRRRAGPGQGAVLQQPRRRRCRARAGQRVRSTRGRDHQARQSLRRGDRRRSRARLRPGARLRSAERLWRRGRAQPAARCARPPSRSRGCSPRS